MLVLWCVEYEHTRQVHEPPSKRPIWDQTAASTSSERKIWSERLFQVLWLIMGAWTRTVYKKCKNRDRHRTLLPQAVMYIDWVWFRCLWTFKAFLVGTFFPHSGQSKPPVFKCLDSMWILTQLRCFEVYSQSLHPWLPSLVLSSLDVTRASITSPPTYSKN